MKKTVKTVMLSCLFWVPRKQVRAELQKSVGMCTCLLRGDASLGFSQVILHAALSCKGHIGVCCC